MARPINCNYIFSSLYPYGWKYPYIVIGLTDIIKLLDELPATVHDPYTFVCDIMACNVSTMWIYI